MSIRTIARGILTIGYFVGGALLAPYDARAQDPKVQKAMEILETAALKLGPPKVEGIDPVAGKEAPAIYFGQTKINNNFELVDKVVKNNFGTATIFVKNGDEYIRVATNVRMDGGSRAIGTILDPNGKVIDSIRKGETYYGYADILGRPYVAGYKPIRDSSKNIIGIYYVGYIIDCSGVAEEILISGCHYR